MLFAEGDKFNQQFIVNEAVYKGFIQTFNDQNPLHTDELFASNHNFKGLVMHGNILNGFISYFVGECLPTKNVIIHSQEIEFKKAVYLNDRLLFEAAVTGVYESVNAVQFKFSFRGADKGILAKGKLQIGLLE